MFRQVEFVFGYSLPLPAAVKRQGGGKYELSLQFSPAIAGIVIRNMTVKVRQYLFPDTMAHAKNARR